jgi:GNAT superfamily N-acetyltransferase
MIIRYLQNDSDEINLVSQWIYDEWGRESGKTLEVITEVYRARAGSTQIPLTVVADDSGLVGTASLVVHDMQSHPELSPWVAGVFTSPGQRGRGVGEQLVKQILDEARRLGHRRCYLFTNHSESFYARRGWQVHTREVYRGKPAVVMAFQLAAG